MFNSTTEAVEEFQYRFSDLIDVPAFVGWLESFFLATGIPNGVVDASGELLFMSGGENACKVFHRTQPTAAKHCRDSNLALVRDLRDGCIASELCRNGLMDYATPVVIEGRQLATLFLGQVLHTPPDMEFFRAQAAQFGFDEKTYLESIAAIPVIDEERLQNLMTVMVETAKMLTISGLARLRQTDLERNIATQTEWNIQLSDVLEFSPIAIGWLENETRIEYINSQFTQLFGYTLDDLPNLETWDKRAYPDAAYREAVVWPWRKAVAQARQNNTPPPELESEITCKNGSVRSIIVRTAWVGHRRMASFTDITEHKRIESVLRSSQEMLVDAQRIAMLGSWDWNIVDDRVEWSEIAYEIYTPDKRPAEPGFEDFKSSLHPDDLERVIAAVQSAFEHDTPFDLDHCVISAGKGVRTVHAQGKVFRDANGKPVRMVGTVQDITARKSIELQLARREREFRALAENSPDLIYRYDQDCRRLYVNSAVSRQLGKPVDTLIGRTPADGALLVSEQCNKLMKAIRQVFASGETGHLDIDCIALDSRHHDYQMLLTPEYDVDGEVLTVLGIARDITALRDVERRLTNFVANFPGFAYTLRLSPEGYCSFPFASPGIEQFYGLKPEDVKDDMAPIHALTHPEDRPRIVAAIAESARTMTPFHVETRICRPNLPERWIEVRSVPIVDADGSIIWHGLMIDIDKRKRADAERQQLLDVLAQSADFVGSGNLDRTVSYLNHAARRMIGLAENADVSGIRIADFHPAWAYRMMEEIAFPTLPEKDFWRGESALLHLDGHEIPVSQLIMLHRNAEGKPLFISTIMTDITAQRREQRLEALRQRVFETMARGGNLNKILEQVAQYVESSKPDRRCGILLLDEKRNCLVSAAAPSFSVSCIAGRNGVTLHKSGWGCCDAACRGELIIVRDIRRQASPENCQSFARETGMTACWSEPIIASSGEILGVINLYTDQAGEPDDQDLALLRHAGQLSAIPIERKRIENRMHHQANYDSLTGLPNRHLLGYRLREDLAKAEQSGNNLALFFIDLDHFKEVNDTLGHDNGDLLLTEAADRIRACARESDTVARLDGDEFVFIFTPVEDLSQPNRLAQSILNAIIRPFALGEHTTYVSASIGIASYPQDAKTAESLISCADQAMYVAKEQGRSNFNFFTPAMQQQMQNRMLLGNDLRNALRNSQLQVYYQPIVDIATGRIVKAEALLRWKHPHRGMVPPDQFIPIAEENGLIHEIGDWVFRQAVSVAQCWNVGSQGPRQISVNLSPRQFMKGNITMVWLEYLQQLDFNPAHIVVEITEGLLLDNRPEIMETLAQFGMAGMQVALDDFGTGYSAMAYLKKFPINYLKIDRSFVRDLETDPNDRAIAEAIVVMAHKLGLKVIAEGVETLGQSELLAAVGCEYVQGFLHAKPMPADEFLSYVAARKCQTRN